MDNCHGLRDHRLVVDGDGLRGLGAIEGIVDRLIADRMKKRGMTWTKQGADRMARLIGLREMRKLNTPDRMSKQASADPSKRKDNTPRG